MHLHDGEADALAGLLAEGVSLVPWIEPMSARVEAILAEEFQAGEAEWRRRPTAPRPGFGRGGLRETYFVWGWEHAAAEAAAKTEGRSASSSPA